MTTAVWDVCLTEKVKSKKEDIDWYWWECTVESSHRVVVFARGESNSQWQL